MAENELCGLELLPHSSGSKQTPAEKREMLTRYLAECRQMYRKIAWRQGAEHPETLEMRRRIDVVTGRLEEYKS